MSTRHIEFDVHFSKDVPEDAQEALASLIESFVNGWSAIMPLPQLRVNLGGFSPSDNG